MAVQEAFLEDLSPSEIRALPHLFEFWALPHQLPPRNEWRTWIILGGRGAGKTRAGAEWVRAMVEGATPRMAGRARRVALVGETIDQAREVMIFGDSGIMALAPPDRRPEWLPQMAEDGASGAMRFRVAQMSALFGAGPISEVAAP